MSQQERRGKCVEKIKILVCDDDKDIVDAIAIYLEQEGFDIIKAYDGYEALTAMKEKAIQLIIMDIMMPQLDGLKATLKIRETMNCPIILLSARSEDTDKIIGLNFGADDYMTKPFNPLELIARVKSQLRRYNHLGSVPHHQNILKTGGLELDTECKVLYVDGEQVNLTHTELGILQLLMRHLGRVYSITEIYEHVWEEEAIAAENTVAVHIRRIREKIEIDPKNPKYVKVVWGIGYKVEKII